MTKKIEQYPCIINGKLYPKDQLLRFITDDNGVVNPDLAWRFSHTHQNAFHLSLDCLEKEPINDFSQYLEIKINTYSANHYLKIRDNISKIMYNFIITTIQNLISGARRAAKAIINVDKILNYLALNYTAKNHSAEKSIFHDLLLLASNIGHYNYQRFQKYNITFDQNLSVDELSAKIKYQHIVAVLIKKSAFKDNILYWLTMRQRMIACNILSQAR